MDTETPTTDLVIIDAELVDDAPSGFGTELAKTAGTTAATAAVMLAGIYAYNRLKPKVASICAAWKNTKLDDESPTIETPEKN